MAEWVCSKCGFMRDSRCKPKTCPECDSSAGFDKKEDIRPAAKVPAKRPAAKVPAKRPAAKVPAKQQAAKVTAKKPAKK